MHFFDLSFPVKKINLKIQKKEILKERANDPEIKACKKGLDVLLVLSRVDHKYKNAYNEERKMYEKLLSQLKTAKYQQKLRNSDNKSKCVWSIISEIKDCIVKNNDISCQGREH